MSTAPRVIHTIAELREGVASLRAERAASLRGPGGGVVGFVPTMGALHDGHLALVERATELAPVVVVSIFVNPLQFGAGEDLDKYPRTLDEDVAKLAERGGVDIVFAPSAQEMYPQGGSGTKISAGAIGGTFEGRSRPGHFDGMLTVVAKLLNIVQPDVAVFGKKDAQQLFLVRRMVRELDMLVRIEGFDIVREDDGLAMSSRNRYLEPEQRRLAVLLSQALEAAASSADQGVEAATAAAQSALAGQPLVTLDYLVIVNPDTFQQVPDDFTGTGLVLVAARVGSTRLIDNETVYFARR